MKQIIDCIPFSAISAKEMTSRGTGTQPPAGAYPCHADFNAAAPTKQPAAAQLPWGTDDH